METKPGLAFVICLLTINGVFSHPLSDQSNGYTPVVYVPECPFGYRFDTDSNKCRLEVKIAGKASGNETLTVLCANGSFDATSKTCIIGVGSTAVILAPKACPSGMEKDRNGSCRTAFNNASQPRKCVFGYDFNPTNGDCHLTKTIAGKVDPSSSKNLFIICPLGYVYLRSGKLCEKAQPRFLIDAPVVCETGDKPDPNGKCRNVFG